jgi:hypothetical protein
MNAKAQMRSSPYWLITGREIDRTEVLTINFPGAPTFGEGQQALPVFSAREDAEEFLEFVRKDGSSQGRISVSGAAGGWRVRRTGRGELLPLLCDSCTGVGKILLDPWPETDAELIVELTGISREAFVNRLPGEPEPTFGRRGLPASKP